MRLNGKLLLSTVLFVLCIAPTIISYQSYTFEWDDSDYLWRAISVSRSFWSGNKHELGIAMLGTPRPPVMTLLGLPWGPLACVFAALGPYPAGADAHFSATAFMADSLFAWTAFAAVLLIPYEATTPTSSTTGALVRGVFWATILLAGAMTKVSFFYFILLIVPALFAIRMRHSGLRSAFVALSSLAICSVPAAIYWLRYGLPALKNGLAASFGHDAPFYYIPFSQFLSLTVRQSAGLLLSVMVTAAGIVLGGGRCADAASGQSAKYSQERIGISSGH